MILQQAIETLADKDWAARKIARELGVNRETVTRYLKARESRAQSKPAIVPAGSGEGPPAKPAIVPAGSKAGRKSRCLPFADFIEKSLNEGLSAQRIYQDLVSLHEYRGSYDSVKRFARRLALKLELPFRRMECAPGQEMQVDFGQGAWVVEKEGKRRRRPHLFRCVLSYSRKGYSEVVWRQTAESFIRALENAFRHFGGVPATVVIDNLKAGVLQADWYDPELNPKLEEFARYYSTVILPTKPGMPRHKGKIESEVKYAQNNGLKGRAFESLSAHNLFLGDWERNVADKRIHGTTRQQVARLFEEVERPVLTPLPAGLFPVFEEAVRKVHRDGYIEYKKAYYSVPPEYLGHQLWVRQEARLLRVYNKKREQIALHTLCEAGKRATDSAHIHSAKRHGIERGQQYLLDRCRLIGPFTGAWAEGMHLARGPAGLRVMYGLLALAEKHPVASLEKAAQMATHHGAWRLRDLKRLLELPGNVVQLDFLETHPLIRSLDAYRIDTNPQDPQSPHP